MQEKYRLCVKAKANEQNIISFGKFRITLLTEELVRLEYNLEKKYVDLPTQIVWNREFPAVRYESSQKEDCIKVETSKLVIYGKNRGRKLEDIEIMKKDSVDQETEKWYIGKQIETLKGTIRTLDGVDGETQLEEGILSKQGVSVLDDSKSYLILENGELQKRETDGVDIYLFMYGLQYQKCLKDYLKLTGASPLLPRYALGNWWSRYHRYTEKEYIDLMDCFAQKKIPLSVAMIDMDWHVTHVDPKYGSGWTGYTWNKELFSEPEEFLKQLHDRKLKTSLNVHPADGVRAFEEPYQEMADAVGEQLHIDKEKGEPIVFDVTNPVFMEAYFTYLHKPNEEKGVDFWWVDWQQGETSDLPGLDPLWVLNHYHYLDNKKESKRPMILSRYAGPGSHRYPIGFSGDSVISWESLTFQPYFTATASNIGYGWWSHDIGGHMLGTYDEELQIRWMQFGVFSPINRMHSSCSEFNHKEPWNYSQETCRVISEYLRLRHKLIPYLYTMNWLAYVDGQMLVQPMYYVEPENEQAYHVPNEYYFGTEMICLPITTPCIKEVNMAKVKGWLPKGRYVDWQKGIIYEGNREVTLYRRLEEMPILLKEGAIVVCASQAENNGVENPSAFEITVVAGADGKFTLYEDDGESFAYQQDCYVCTDFVLDYQNQGEFVIGASCGDTRLIPQRREYTIRFLGFVTPKAVLEIIDGVEREVPLINCENKNEFVVSVQGDITQAITLRFADGMKQTKNKVQQLCFERLDKAQISYVKKETIYNRLKNGEQLSDLREYIMDEEVYEALAEVIYAQGEEAWEIG